MSVFGHFLHCVPVIVHSVHCCLNSTPPGCLGPLMFPSSFRHPAKCYLYNGICLPSHHVPSPSPASSHDDSGHVLPGASQEQVVVGDGLQSKDVKYLAKAGGVKGQELSKISGVRVSPTGALSSEHPVTGSAPAQPSARRAESQTAQHREGRVHGKMSDSLVVCDVDPALTEKLRKFRFRKETNNAAILMKIDKERQLVVLEEEFQDISPEELRSELPERQPRFVVYSYKYVHDDGRISYPLCFIFSSPAGCKPEQQMMYAGSKNRLVQTAELTKVFEIRTTEDLTEEWLRGRLAFFR